MNEPGTHNMDAAITLAERYEAAGLDVPNEARRALEVWKALADAHWSPEDTSLADVAGELTADNIHAHLDRVAFGLLRKGIAHQVRDTAQHPLAQSAVAAFNADQPRRHKVLRPKFLKAADVIVKALELHGNGALTDESALRLDVNPDTAADEFAKRTDLARAVQRVKAAQRELDSYAPLLSRRKDPAAFIALDDDDGVEAWREAVEVYPDWLRLYAIPGVAPAVKDLDQTAALVTHIEALHQREQAAEAEANRTDAHPADVELLHQHGG